MKTLISKNESYSASDQHYYYSVGTDEQQEGPTSDKEHLKGVVNSYYPSDRI